MTASFSKVLVIDDEEMIGETLQDILTEVGYSVTVATGGVEGLQFAVQDKFDLIISDIKMPELNGVEIFHQVQRVAKTPMILMTGYSDILDITEAYRIGVSEFVTKPFTRDDLLSAVKLVEHESSGDAQANRTFDYNYCRIFIDEFVSKSKSTCDVYLKLAVNKYVRIAKKEAPLSFEQIKNIQSKGLEFLYVTKEDFAQFVGLNYGQAKNIGNFKKVAKRRKLPMIQYTVGSCLQKAHIKGLEPVSFEISRGIVESCLNLVMDHDEMLTLLEQLRTHSERSYIHSVAVAMYSVLIAVKWRWRGASTLFKVALAGLYHDIGKKEIPQDILEIEPQNMTTEVLRVFATHSQKGRDILLSVAALGEEVAQVAYQHHENLAGTGYPQRLFKVRLQPLARIVLTANVFCDMILPLKKENALSASQALYQLHAQHKEEVDLGALKALMEAFQLDIPSDIAKINFGQGRDLNSRI